MPTAIYRKNGDHDYVVMAYRDQSMRPIGFVMRYFDSHIRPVCARWNAIDMVENSRDFPTRKAAGKWLLERM